MATRRPTPSCRRRRSRCSAPAIRPAASPGTASTWAFRPAAALDRLTSLFFQFEFVPLTQNYGLKPREEFEGKYNQALIGSGDPNFYFVGGMSLKF